MAPVIANVPLLCTDPILIENDALNDWLKKASP